MPKIAKELGPLDVKRISAPGVHFVGGVPGLILQVANSGAKSWLLRVMVGEKRREIGLGAYPGVGLALAREKAQATRDAISSGVDPVAHRAAARQSIIEAQQEEKAMQWTFQRCAEAYIKAKSHEWKNAKHGKQWTSTLETYVYPVIGDVLVRNVGIGQVTEILEPHWLTKTETMTRVRNRVELVLDWATARKYRSGDNPAKWKGNLDKLLAEPSKVAPTVNHRSLPASGMYEFLQNLRSHAGNGARCLEFVILTACRSGEARGATWAEIDFDAKTWTIPAERMKANRQHTVPLSEDAIRILKANSNQRFDLKPGDLIFPGAKAGRPLSDMTLTKVMRDMNVDAVPHGFRSTFSSWCASSTAYPADVREMALAHTVGDATMQAYQRSDLFEKRRHLMDDWAAFVNTAPTTANNVVNLRTA